MKINAICAMKFVASLALAAVFTTDAFVSAAELSTPLDRQAIVARHRIKTTDLNLSLQVGNGNLCFNVDGTGLQTFGGDTLSHWGWYSEALPAKYTWDDVPETGTYQQGRLTGGDPWPGDKGDLYGWVRESPHQINLARVRFLRSNGAELQPSEISNVQRDLDLWTGVHKASFTLDGEQVSVETCVSDDVKLDSTIAIRVDSELVREGKLVVQVDFPYPNLARGPWTGDFSDDARERLPYAVSTLGGDGKAVLVKRELKNEYMRGVVGDFSYSARVDALVGGKASRLDATSSVRVVGDKSAQTLDMLVSFDGGDYSLQAADDSLVQWTAPSFDDVESVSCARWENFWRSGAAVDLSGSSDPRWFELERRIVLSQFQLRTNAAGDWPCSESGLITVCPWSGRFHMEMVWWHLLHYWTWDRAELADQAISIYPKVQDGARSLAKQLGYKGMKWQKEIAPDGRTAPWVGNLVLLWKQPHPIFFAEMDYRRNPTRETLEKWDEIVEETAVHMADYATKDENGVYHLAPAMPPCEQGITRDENFDLAYWAWGLAAANTWRERLGKEREPLWDDVCDRMAPLTIADGVYVHSAEWTDTFAKRNFEHPELIGVYGMIPPLASVDPAVVEKTLERVIPEWQWERCWGWDFPWVAMCASRLGRPDLAVDFLLKDTICNVYDESGVNLGGPSARGGKGPYLPGNGGLLYAIAGMCAGYDETSSDDNTNAHMPKSGDSAPGFPEGWSVKWEGLKRPL